MLLILIVSLYTSRVVLKSLGADDYGLYNLVGGVVGMLAFLNGTLSTATSRFLSFDIGLGDSQKLRQTFSTTFYSHFGLGIIAVILLESFGLWYVLNKAIIPIERLDATLVVFHISVVTVLISFTQVPYTALIMAQERMEAFAYISLLEVFLKLLCAILLTYSLSDKLVLYAIFMFIAQVIVALTYRCYCYKRWRESHLTKRISCDTLKEILSFSSWNIISHISETLRSQGLVMLLGMFFLPAIVAAQSIATQLSHGITQFTNNFRSAINPQIIKLYAVGDEDSSKRLTLESSLYVFDLFVLIGIPLLLLTEPILEIWLEEVPEYTCQFARCIIISAMFGTFSGSFYTPLTASGKMKGNAIWSIILCGLQFIITYFLLRGGANVMIVQYVAIFISILFAFVAKPFLLIKKMNYEIHDFVRIYIKAGSIFLTAFIVPYLIHLNMNLNNAIDIFIVLIISLIWTIVVIWFYLPRKTRTLLINYFKTRINDQGRN